METNSGVFRSPGYPVMKDERRDCEWVIKVPVGRRITVKLEDFDLEENVDFNRQGMAFFNGQNFDSRILYMVGGNTTRIIESTDNIMAVYYWSSHTSFHRGFVARYTSKNPTCMTILLRNVVQ